MYNDNLIVSYPGFFVAEYQEEALWLKFSGNFFHNILSFDRMDFLHNYFKMLSEDNEFKTIVIQSGYSESGSDEYLRFFLFDCPEQELGHFGFSNTMNRYELHRFCNIIDQAILDILSTEKIFIHICSGDVLSLFMNISLACDCCIISEDTVFHNIYHEIGMLPKGGSSFMLSRSLGPGKAKALLLKERITALEAHENKIAELVVSPGQLENSAIKMVRQFNAIPDQTLLGIKRLVNRQFHGIKEYLEYETEQILKIGQDHHFSDQ